MVDHCRTGNDSMFNHSGPKDCTLHAVRPITLAYGHNCFSLVLVVSQIVQGLGPLGLSRTNRKSSPMNVLQPLKKA